MGDLSERLILNKDKKRKRLHLSQAHEHTDLDRQSQTGRKFLPPAKDKAF